MVRCIITTDSPSLIWPQSVPASTVIEALFLPIRHKDAAAINA